MAPHSLSCVMQVSERLKILNWFEKILFTLFLLEKMFTVAAQLSSEVVAWAGPLIKVCKYCLF